MPTFAVSRRNGIRTIACVAAMVLVTFSCDAWGQTGNSAQWRRGTTLGGFAGAATANGTNAAAGTALGWEIVPRLTIEGRGVWLRHDPGSSDFFAWLGALVHVRPEAAIVPFASAGVGMYRATVEASAGNVPEFYQRRLNGRARATFEDLATGVGAGASVFVTPHVAIRPEANVLFVTTRAETRAVTVYGVQVAYHFEPHKTR